MSLSGESGNRHAEQRKHRVCSVFRPKIEPGDLWIQQVRVGWLLGSVQQLRSIDDLQDGISVVAVADVHAVACRSGGDGTVDVLKMPGHRRRIRRVGLLARQAEVADEHRLRRIGQVVDLQHADGVPGGITADQVSDSGVAFPPVLVRVAKPAHHDGQTAWLCRIGDVPGFVCGRAEAAQQVHLASVCARVIAAVTDAHHLRAPRFAPTSRVARNMGQVPWLLRIGDVDNRRPVRFLLAGQGIELGASMVADVGDPAFALFLDNGLIGASGLKIVVADQVHVVFFDALLRGCHSAQHHPQCHGHNCKTKMPHLNLPFVNGSDPRRTRQNR